LKPTKNEVNNQSRLFNFLDFSSKSQINEILTIITEADIADSINKARGRLLPGFTPYNSAVNLITTHQKKWKSPSLDCLHAIYEIMTHHVNDAIDKTFSRFPALVGRMRYII